MAEFHEIGSSQFTETTSPTGEEMIQISATQKVKLKTIITYHDLPVICQTRKRSSINYQVYFCID